MCFTNISLILDHFIQPINNGIFHVGPAKVKAHKYILFTEGFLEVKIKNTFFTLLSH